MSERVKSFRLNIDEDANKKIELMLNNIKTNNEYVKINSSKMGSWIVNRFYDSYFKKEKNKMVSDHFQKLDYLKHILNDMDENLDPESMLKFMHKKIKKAQSSILDEVQKPCIQTTLNHKESA